MTAVTSETHRPTTRLVYRNGRQFVSHTHTHSQTHSQYIRKKFKRLCQCCRSSIIHL